MTKARVFAKRGDGRSHSASLEFDWNLSSFVSILSIFSRLFISYPLLFRGDFEFFTLTLTF